jgi:DNA-binding CsgD family transcriptional regulator
LPRLAEPEILDSPTPHEIVGRELERAAIEGWLERPGPGARVLMVEGEAGAGRTLLWQDSLRSAHRLGYRVLVSRPSELDSSLSFSVLGDLLDAADGRLIDALPAPQRAAVQAALLQADAGGPIPVRGVALGVLSILRQLAQAAPVLLAVDDVHWMDESSAIALAFALRRIDDEHVLLLGALRSGSPAAFASGLALPDHQRQTLRLPPLSEEAVVGVLRAHLGKPIPWPEAAEVHHLAGGNPAVALEIGRALRRGEIGHRPAEPLPVPGSLRPDARRRLAGLPAATLDALLVVAAQGRPAVRLFERALGASSPAGLQPAAERGLVEIAGDLIRVLEPLALSFVYWDADPERRADVHRQLAGAAPDRAERLRHLALCSPEPAARLATELEEATTRTAERGALREAEELAELTLRLTPPGRREQLGRRRLLAAELRLATGDAGGVTDLLEAASAGRLPGPRRAHLLRLLAQARLLDAGTRSSVEVVAGIVVEPAQAERVAVEAGEGLAVGHLLAGDLPRTDAETGGPDGPAGANGGDEPFEGLRQMQEQLEASAGWPSSTLLRARFALWDDDLAGALRGLQGLERQAREAGNALVLPILLARLAEVECWLGGWLEAAVLSHRGWELAVASSQRAMGAHLLYTSALSDVHRGTPDTVRESALRGEEVAARAGFRPLAVLNRAVLGHLELSLGNAAAAQLDFIPLVESRWTPGTEPGLARFLPDAVEALVARGDLEHAGRLIAVLESLGRQLGVRWPLASAARCRAALESARGRHDEAQRLFWQAIEEDRRLGRDLDLGRDLLAQGVALRHQRNHRSARAALGHAVAVFTRLGTRPWSERARSELRRVAGQDRAGGELDHIERRVAELVAQGVGFTEIANLLFIQPRAVQSYLNAAYRKLGVRSRVALAYRLGVRPR